MVLEHEHDPERVPLYRFLGPRYWLLWLGLGLVALGLRRPVRTLALVTPALAGFLVVVVSALVLFLAKAIPVWRHSLSSSTTLSAPSVSS